MESLSNSQDSKKQLSDNLRLFDLSQNQKRELFKYFQFSEKQLFRFQNVKKSLQQNKNLAEAGNQLFWDVNDKKGLYALNLRNKQNKSCFNLFGEQNPAVVGVEKLKKHYFASKIVEKFKSAKKSTSAHSSRQVVGSNVCLNSSISAPSDLLSEERKSFNLSKSQNLSHHNQSSNLSNQESFQSSFGSPVSEFDNNLNNGDDQGQCPLMLTSQEENLFGNPLTEDELEIQQINQSISWFYRFDQYSEQCPYSQDFLNYSLYVEGSNLQFERQISNGSNISQYIIGEAAFVSNFEEQKEGFMDFGDPYPSLENDDSYSSSEESDVGEEPSLCKKYEDRPHHGFDEAFMATRNILQQQKYTFI